MKDVQKSHDARGIEIQHVGVNEVHLPFLIKKKEGGFQQVLASIRFTVSLPEKYKGTHMSRFLEVLMPWSQKPIESREMDSILSDALTRLEAESASLKIRFKYFIEKSAPVSGRKSLLDIDCSFSGEKKRGESMQFTLGVVVPCTSLCPCSKEISEYGAHNQRSVIRVKLRCESAHRTPWIEDIAKALEKCASCQIYPTLKREDEKYVTEHAYDNPKFVEDILRDTVLTLRKLPGIKWFSIECENFESIHNHNAFASHEETIV